MENFKSLSQVLLNKIKDINITIEHIGSTAVPELDSKPIIDIDIVYFNDVDFEKIKLQLEKIGYYHNGNQGILDRDVFKRSKINNHPILDNITHHLYVCPKHSKELERHLLFRDFLRQHASIREEYQELKYEISKIANQDKKKYAQLKEVNTKEFINKIIQLAIESNSL